MHNETPPVREVTNRQRGEPFLQGNGLGSYQLARETPDGQLEYAPNIIENNEIKQEAAEDLQERLAGGWFSTGELTTWYPMKSTLAELIFWKEELLEIYNRQEDQEHQRNGYGGE
jgi:hypothetical protein